MRVRLEGTGTAAGLPVPGCPCRRCRAAVAGGVRRAPLHATVEDGPVLSAPGELEVAGKRLLWAPDGVLPPGRTPYDLVLLGLPGDLPSWGLALAELRRQGRVTASTTVCAVGIGHALPAQPELAALLALWGAQLPVDGETVGGPTAAAGLRPPRALVLGGARSGKSAHAELRLMAEPRVTYVATAPPRPDDADWAARVQAHIRRRPGTWSTVETGDVAGRLAGEGAVLVDDLGLWLVRQLDGSEGWSGPVPAAVDAATERLVAAWAACTCGAVLVAPEVGGGVVPGTPSGRRFRDLLGALTARLAEDSDEVVQVTAGVPRRLR